MRKCVICGKPIDINKEPYFKFSKIYICDDSVNVECIVNWCGQHRKNEDKTQ